MTINHKNKTIATEYCNAMAKKDIAAIQQYLHDDVVFIGPLSTIHGKSDVINSVDKFMSYFNSLVIRSAFSSENQAVVIYDIEFPEPIGDFSSAALMTIHEGKILKIELFFDARPFVR